MYTSKVDRKVLTLSKEHSSTIELSHSYKLWYTYSYSDTFMNDFKFFWVITTVL